MKSSEKLPKSEIKFSEERVVNQSTKFKHISSGDILTFYQECKTRYQKVHMQTYKRISDGKLFNYGASEVEQID